MIGLAEIRVWPWKTARTMPHCSIEEWNEVARAFQENVALIAELEAKLAEAEAEIRTCKERLQVAESERDAAVAEANDLIIAARSVISEISCTVPDCEIPPCSGARRLREAQSRMGEK